MTRWYVIHTQPHAETKALGHLRRQGYDVYLPRYQAQRRHARKIDWVSKPLFPRYLFVKLNLEAQRWRAILSTVGVSSMIMRGDRPAHVPDGVVDEIQSHEDSSGLVVMSAVQKPTMQAGDAIEVLQGAFAEHRGFFQTMTDSERVIVLLNLFGRNVRVRLPLSAVVAAG